MEILRRKGNPLWTALPLSFLQFVINRSPWLVRVFNRLNSGRGRIPGQVETPDSSTAPRSGRLTSFGGISLHPTRHRPGDQMRFCLLVVNSRPETNRSRLFPVASRQDVASLRPCERAPY
jgi:hypothetical protein